MYIFFKQPVKHKEASKQTQGKIFSHESSVKNNAGNFIVPIPNPNESA
jgi:hypothetical protein